MSLSRSQLLRNYLDERPKLLRIAYRILGSQSESEDILQEKLKRIASHLETLGALTSDSSKSF